MKTLREYVDILDEISRRDALKYAGATAGLAATDTLAAPWQHTTSKDPMDDTVHKEINVLSTDKRVRLHVGISSDFVQLQTNDLIDYEDYGRSGGRGYGLFRLATLAPDLIYLRQAGRYSRYINLESDKIDFKRTLLALKNPTVVKVQVPILGKNSRIYTFEIQPDKITKSYDDSAGRIEQQRLDRIEQQRLDRIEQQQRNDILQKSKEIMNPRR